MQNSKQDWINITYNKTTKKLKAKLSLLVFKEEDFVILYSPSLKLSAYGNTKDEAHEMMRVSLDDFCESLFEGSVKKVVSELHKLGWSQSPYASKDFSRSAYVDKSGVLKDLSLPEDTEVEEEVMELA